MTISSSSHGWYVTSSIPEALNEKLIHFTQWCLRTLGLNSLHKWLKTAGIYLRSGIAAGFLRFQFHLMLPNCSSKWLYQFIPTPAMEGVHCSTLSPTNRTVGFLVFFFFYALHWREHKSISVFWTCISVKKEELSSFHIFVDYLGFRLCGFPAVILGLPISKRLSFFCQFVGTLYIFW